ncbi:GNAT family N-acetyltransferase [Konateibacter massiliensis]|uniref:GNAT family N-acetyltransferase n=1 Tax=Konateibacter massiliensis TaxID=2002841 RepID=UPI000C1544A5|nr:GNAT family N-acetyltransferase [Konateibacter massiliensis]
MKHCGTVELTTDRLILRRFCVEDAERMYRNWASDDEVTKFLTWPSHGSAEGTKQLIEVWEKEYNNQNTYNWAITLKNETDNPIGSIGIVEQNEAVDKVQIGYCIGKKWWNQGITSEALQAVITFLFEQVGANRIEAKHDTNNQNSGSVMKKCGMTFEGILRQSDRNNQGICDTSYYSILKSEC